MKFIFKLFLYSILFIIFLIIGGIALGKSGLIPERTMNNITLKALQTYINSESEKAGEYSWNQKVTLVVEMEDGKTYSGSSVMKVMWNKNKAASFNKAANPWLLTIQGEMPYLKLPDNRYIFSLFSKNGNSKLLAWHLLDSIVDSYDISSDKIANVLQNKEAYINIPESDERFPILVSFGDIYTPETIYRFNPVKANLLVEITNLEISEPKILSILPWLPEISSTVSVSSNSKTMFFLEDGKPGVAYAPQYEFIRN